MSVEEMLQELLAFVLLAIGALIGLAWLAIYCAWWAAMFALPFVFIAFCFGWIT